MIKNKLFSSLFLLFSSLLFAQDAGSIIQSTLDRIDEDTVSTRATMLLTSKNGTVTERLVDQYGADSDDKEQAVIIFQKPASVAGTRFLTIREGDNDDKWIFLPSLGKVRRIASSEGSSSFMGTDFSYDDLSASNRDVEEDTHSILGEELLNGHDCWIIESVPKDSGYQYSKIMHWIEKNSFVEWKSEMYDKQGDQVKVLESLSFEDIQGNYTPVKTRMTNVQTGTSTTVETSIIKYNDAIPESVFTTRFLMTGRP